MLDQTDSIFKLFLSEWDRRERIKRKLGASNLAFAILRRFRDIYNSPTGSTVETVGFLTQRDGQLFVEMPPRELISFYPKIKTILTLPVQYTASHPPPIGTITNFKGTIQAQKISKNLRRSSKIKTRRILVLEDWGYDYREAYLESPITLDEILKMIREKFTPEPPLEYALLFSAISAPTTFQKMGGISSLVSTTTLNPFEMEDIGRFLQNLVPSWHHQKKRAGFSMPLHNGLNQDLIYELTTRHNFLLEYSPLVVRSGTIDLFRERGFFELDDPVVLERSTIGFDESYKEFKEFKPEIQWSIMSAHLHLTEITSEELPANFDRTYQSWVSNMIDDYDFFNSLYLVKPHSFYSIVGRKGMVIRAAGSLARLRDSDINTRIVNDTLDIAEKLFIEYDLAHRDTLREYERDPTSPYYGSSESDKVRQFRSSLVDRILSQDGITSGQIYREGKKHNLTKEKVHYLFESLKSQGILYEPEPDRYKITP